MQTADVECERYGIYEAIGLSESLGDGMMSHKNINQAVDKSASRRGADNLTWTSVKGVGLALYVNKCKDVRNCPPFIKKIGGVEYVLGATVNINQRFAEQSRELERLAYMAREQGLFVRTIKASGATCATMSLYLRPRALADQSALGYILGSFR